MIQTFNPSSKISKELRFILSCANGNRTLKNDEDHITELDWNTVVMLSLRHGLFPLVYNSLRQLNNSLIPDQAINTLKCNYIKNAVKTTNLTDEIIRIVKYMSDQGIEPLILKGPPISVRINEDIALRPSGDIDILVDIDEFDKAERLLEQLNYIRLSPDFPLTKSQRKFYMRNDHHFEYYHLNRASLVELHWRIRSYEIKHYSSLSNINTQTVDISGLPVRVMDDEYWLIYLMVHGYKHQWSRLRWLYDIKQLITNKIDWDKVKYIEKQSEVISILHQTLILLHILFEVPYPAQLQESVENDQRAWSLTEVVLEELNNVTLIRSGTLSARIKKIDYFNFNSNWKKRLTGFISLLKPDEKEFKRITLPDRLFPLYYILKLFYYLKKFFGSILPKRKNICRYNKNY